MFAFVVCGRNLVSLLASSSATEKTAYCIYVKNQETCTKLAASLSTTTTTYKSKNLIMEQVNTTTVPASGSGEIIMFVEGNEITSKQLTTLIGTDKRKIYANGNLVTVNVGAYDEFKEIPLSLSYKGGPIVFKPEADTTLSLQEIQKIKIQINLQATMKYTIHDTCNCTIPPNFIVNKTKSGSLTYNLETENLDKTRLIIDGDSVKWGKTIFSPESSQLTLPTGTIISCSTAATAPKIPVKVGGGCFFDESFAEKTSEYAEIDAVSYVLDANKITYIKKTSSITPVAYKVFCVHDETITIADADKMKGCEKSGFNKMTHQKLSGTAITEKNIVSFNGEVNVPKDKLSTLKSVLLTNDATQITMECDKDTLPDQKIDVRKGIWRLKKAAAAVVPGGEGGALTLAVAVDQASVSFTGEVNPKIVNQNPEGITLTAGGVAITIDDNKESVDLSKVTVATGDIPITPYLEGEAKVEVQKGTIIVNGVTLKIPTAKSVTLKTVPGQNVELSQKGATKEMKISIKSTGKVSFDASWNSINESFVSVQGATVSTQYVGIPPWLDSSSVASLGTIEQPKPGQQTPPSTGGLEGWAIALIVIACVIVVGVSVVVALNMAGVIHLCGKKKVEV